MSAEPRKPAKQHPTVHEVQTMASAPMTRRSHIIKGLDPSSSRPYKTHPRVRGYVDGCFDVMHSGHYNLFRQARMLCDELVVGVHSAEQITLTKKCSPVQTDEERMRLVASCKWVDEVILSKEYSPDYEKVLEQFDCDFCIHGNDINLNAEGKDPFEKVKKLGMFRSIERVDFISSTDIINRLLKATHKDLRVQRRTEDEEDADSFLLTTDRLCQFMNTTRHQPHKPREGQRVVYVCGSFDLFHSGHVRLLQEAKKLGDFLLVGIHEDTSVQTHCGPGFPIMNLFERAMNVLGCRDVDEVVFDAPFIITEHMIDFLHIDIIVEPSMKIDYPNDSQDMFEYVRTRDQKTQSSASVLTSKFKSLLVKDDKKLRPIELTKIELPEAEVLRSTTLIERIKDNREAYEARNKSKSGEANPETAATTAAEGSSK